MQSQTRTTSSNASATTDRRRGYRQPTAASAILRAVEPDVTFAEPVPVHVFEHSISGVAFSAADPLPLGSLWRLAPADPRLAPRTIEIRSCRTRNDGMCDLGAKYI